MAEVVMGQWKYYSDGGTYTVEEQALRNLIADGKVSGQARVTRLDDATQHRVDVEFPREYRAALDAAAWKHAAVPAAQAARKASGRGRTVLIFLFLLAAGAYGFYWYTNRITCARSEVQRLVGDIVKTKLLNFSKGEVAVHNISTLGTLDAGGARCSADVEITGSGLYDGLHGVEYSAEVRGNSLYVSARITR